MKLSTRSRYGTRMVLDIAMHGDEGPVRISDISERQGISVKYLEKLIRPLKLGGYVQSKRGPKGGHKLTRKPNEITVGEIVRLLEGELLLTECARDKGVCPISEDCLTRRIWIEASEVMYDRLNAINFQELMDEAQRAGATVEKCVPAKYPPPAAVI